MKKLQELEEALNVEVPIRKQALVDACESKEAEEELEKAVHEGLRWEAAEKKEEAGWSVADPNGLVGVPSLVGTPAATTATAAAAAAAAAAATQKQSTFGPYPEA